MITEKEKEIFSVASLSLDSPNSSLVSLIKLPKKLPC